MPNRRSVLCFAGAALLCPVLPGSAAFARSQQWVEVLGSASVNGANDRDAARRRALADALLSAALAGGALVKGHSVMSGTRMTSDLLIVTPTASVLAHQVVAEEFDGRLWRIRIRAQIGQPSISACSGDRQLFVTMYPPRARVSPAAPAWAAALANDLGYRLAELAEAHPAVAGLTRSDRLPNDDPARDKGDYRGLTGGNARIRPGGHGLFTDITVEPSGGRLNLSLRLTLKGPAGEKLEKLHDASVRLPRPSLLGAAAVLAQPDRQGLADQLAGGARPALSDLLKDAGCRPVLARLELSGGQLVVPVGRAHGVARSSLAFTADAEASTEVLEVVQLADRSTVLMPLDPALSLKRLAGRPVRFFETAVRL
ncbi:flagellar assembly protein T N-terminal domain-containing protein [Pseudotabrizicola algicola]|uniref:Flagellar assembly protein T N-terminal domain-containing protein n=1 Tax=Pseudotabrizicola algicola TaxID=2709381 RepID=A0A6B3RQC0_9RHOB|nr:flagellar assembly protein T N-terminal domain-containing protein [Pseudotabrizicola algicola]NEX45262.1 hypothetical protein [Pseudotabrizicola algicola]